MPKPPAPPEGPLSAPPAPDTGFATGWRVRAGDVDPSNRLRLDGVARYLQDIAWDNLHAVSFDGSDPAWIVRRTIIDVIEPVNWPDEVNLRRWCGGLFTFWADMRVTIRSTRGGLIETAGFWINVNEKTGRPAKISDGGRAQLGLTTAEHRLRWRAWLDAPAPAASPSDLEFPVRATDIDQYNHVNNAVYWQAAEHYLAEYPELTAGPYRAVIEYNAAVAPKAHITIRSDYRAGTLRLWFMVDGETTTCVRVGPLPTATA